MGANNDPQTGRCAWHSLQLQVLLLLQLWWGLDYQFKGAERKWSRFQRKSFNVVKDLGIRTLLLLLLKKKKKAKQHEVDHRRQHCRESPERWEPDQLCFLIVSSFCLFVWLLCLEQGESNENLLTKLMVCARLRRLISIYLLRWY